MVNISNHLHSAFLKKMKKGYTFYTFYKDFLAQPKGSDLYIILQSVLCVKG